ncbi:MAG TPA: hypothetical protein PKN45_04185 [Candidatus Limiplasma sp.]|nr:hypothetical protein [Candidatus Limiplasma sp.]
MSIQTRVLATLVAMINSAPLFVPVTQGPLPSDGGISLNVTGGRTETVTLSGGQTVTLEIALNSKHTDRAAALDALCALHEALTRADALPCGEGWQIVALRTAAAPGYLDRDGAYWLFGSTLNVTYTAD